MHRMPTVIWIKIPDLFNHMKIQWVYYDLPPNAHVRAWHHERP